MRIGAPDASLTGCAGVAALAEADRVLALTVALDRHIPAFKQRDRGLSAGQVLTALASCQLTGGDHLVALDRRRADAAGQELEPVPTPASTTAAGLARRFGPDQLAGIEAGIAAVNAAVLDRLGQVRVSALRRQVTIDVDATDVEVYGPGKAGCAYSYLGQRAYRAHIAVWAELGVPVAADLLAGDEDPRSGVVELIERVGRLLPAGIGQVALRMDTGYFAADAALAAQRLGMVFAIGVKRNPAVWRAAMAAPAHAWIPVIGMPDTEVTVIGYAPAGWPAQIACLARRTRIPAGQVSTDPRARKRRTIPKNQLALALEGRIDHVYGYSFILTNQPIPPAADPDQPADGDGDRDGDGDGDGEARAEALAEAEYWYRHRTDIEALNKDSKHGAALRHLPSGDKAVNQVWMWAALLACALSAWIQELTGIDRGNGRGRRTIRRLHHELINIPARIIHPGRTTTLRLPPGANLLTVVLPRLQALPSG